ncbi:MAG: hypothetical protein ABIK28_02520 [Planctomycetota bacterium]
MYLTDPGHVNNGEGETAWHAVNTAALQEIQMIRRRELATRSIQVGHGWFRVRRDADTDLAVAYIVEMQQAIHEGDNGCARCWLGRALHRCLIEPVLDEI